MKMEENNPTEQKKDKISKLQEWYLMARFLFIIALVVALGIFIINQVIDYRYKVEFIKTPCGLCKELNANQSSCIDNCFKYERSLYPDGFGNWKDQATQKCYGFNGIEQECKGYGNATKQEVNYSAFLVPLE